MKQPEGGLIFDAVTIQRMEVLILGALNWRMRSITPFSFIPFFISLFKIKDPQLIQALKARATEIILKAQTGKCFYSRKLIRKESPQSPVLNSYATLSQNSGS